MISQFFDELTRRLHDLFLPFLEWLYLAEWWVVLALIAAGCFALAYFFNIPLVRAILGFVLAVAGAFVAGGTAMYRHMRREQRNGR